MARQHTPRDVAEHQANVNQVRHEPVPASRQDDRAPALGTLSAADQPSQPAPAPSGTAAQQLMGGPEPQGPVPNAPGVQVAAVDSADGRVTRIRAVSNAVPGQPDGEVDTRS